MADPDGSAKAMLVKGIRESGDPFVIMAFKKGANDRTHLAKAAGWYDSSMTVFMSLVAVCPE